MRVLSIILGEQPFVGVLGFCKEAVFAAGKIGECRSEG